MVALKETQSNTFRHSELDYSFNVYSHAVLQPGVFWMVIYS